MKRSALLAPLMLAACSGVQSPLNSAGAQAQNLMSLFGLMLWVCGAMYLLVLGFLGWALWRARARLGLNEPPAVAPEDGRLNRGLGVWAALITIGLTVLIVGSFLAERGLARADARDAIEVRVTGHQWWWRIQYRDPSTGGWIETANELHLPAGRTTRIALGSADVIHSFWVPNVAGKMDVVPGRINTIMVSPTRVGWFRGQCAEFCGSQHAHMAFDVKVDPPAEFARWLKTEAQPAAPPADALAAQGQAVFVTGACGACHVVRGTAAGGRPGPDLTHLAARRSLAAGTLPFTRGALQGWITQPQALKPGTSMPPVAMRPTDLNAVSHYLEMLR